MKKIHITYTGKRITDLMLVPKKVYKINAKFDLHCSRCKTHIIYLI